MTLNKAIRFYESGSPEVMRYEDVEVGEPSAGQVRLHHVAVGLNYVDTYFRNGPSFVIGTALAMMAYALKKTPMMIRLVHNSYICSVVRNQTNCMNK